ncbi:hypothetical protein O3M35_001573 [Rhynocoris fuscipes]|uniref:Cytochrome P450 n=1 Tax=Rhynocoris fuscipes TaxID=488301 RepID=A0AAW1CQI2_9HEMI
MYLVWHTTNLIALKIYLMIRKFNMEFITFPLIVFIILYAFIILKKFIQNSNKKYPPGPCYIPIIGNSYLIKRYCMKYGGLHNALMQLCTKYRSDIIGFNLSGKYVVAIQNDELCDEALLKDELLGRPDSFFIKLRSMGTNKGITMTNGDLWQEQRAFAMKHLRNLGFGKKIMENLIKEEIQMCIENIESDSINVNFKATISKCVVNVLWAFVTGSRFQRDELLDELISIMTERSKAFDMAGGMLSQFPWIRFIAPEASGYNLIKKLNYKLKCIISGTIEEHKKTYSQNITRDFIDAFLHEMYKTRNGPTTFTEDQLIMVCVDLFIAGSVTTSSKIDFLIVQMLVNRDVQQNVYEEISKILKPGEIASLLHKDQMPYVNAVILENDRMYPITPVIGPRNVLAETTLGGYTLPKDTTVLINLWTSSRNENKWKNPDKFCPMRFLKCNEEKKVLFTFGKGKRRCPGEILAKNFIYLFFTSLINNFQIENGNKEVESIKVLPGMLLTAQPYEVKLIRRHI